MPMSRSAILDKLTKLLTKGISSEADALYLMVETRKLLEQQQAKKQYEYLTFHCDWALHAQLQGAMAQQILKRFDEANIHLKSGGVELHELPGLLRMDIDRISKMTYFKQEFESFLQANALPTLASTRSDGWTHFVHLYSRIVEDCPLLMTNGNASATIVSVLLQVELAKKVEHGEMFFQVRWIIKDKNGASGEIFVINSFSANPQGRHRETAKPAV
jgi:hypothetical protein